MIHPPRRRAALLLPLCTVGLVLAGCGGGSPSSSKAATATTSTTAAASARAGRNAQLADFRACMAAQGEPLPTFAPRSNNGTPPSSVPDGQRPPGGGFGFGGGGAGGFLRGLNQSDPKVQAAYNACKSKIPAALIQQQQQTQQAFTAFASCMKDHGVTITTGPPAPGTTRTTLDTTSAAYQTCKVLLPQGGFGPGRDTTTTTAGAQ